MRIVTDLSSGAILQVEKSPLIGEARAYNGRYPIHVPEGASVAVDSSSYVLPVDGGDVSSLAFQSMLSLYPMYTQVVFNPLLTAADVALLDLAAVYTPTGDVTRARVGRGAGPLSTGCMPGATCVLKQNNLVAPARPGVLITDTIDIGPLTGGLGTDEFMVYWKLHSLSTSVDATSATGAYAGVNEPAVRSISEVGQSPPTWAVYLSHDDGANYLPMSRMTPVDFGSMGSLLRLAFVNTSNATDQYLASYGILF